MLISEAQVTLGVFFFLTSGTCKFHGGHGNAKINFPIIGWKNGSDRLLNSFESEKKKIKNLIYM